ncbi:MAG: hypothetical protein ACRDZW_03720 [Acidimicrobiales bacterium]
MSSGIALVRFGDGTVMVGNYHGTSDLLVPRLFDTAMEATDAYFEGRDGWSDPEGDVEDVVVYVDYGGSFWFEAKATQTSVLPQYCDPLDANSEEQWAGVIQAACSSRSTTASRTGRRNGFVAD